MQHLFNYLTLTIPPASLQSYCQGSDNINTISGAPNHHLESRDASSLQHTAHSAHLLS